MFLTQYLTRRKELSDQNLLHHSEATSSIRLRFQVGNYVDEDCGVSAQPKEGGAWLTEYFYWTVFVKA